MSRGQRKECQNAMRKPRGEKYESQVYKKFVKSAILGQRCPHHLNKNEKGLTVNLKKVVRESPPRLPPMLGNDGLARVVSAQ